MFQNNQLTNFTMKIEPIKPHFSTEQYTVHVYMKGNPNRTLRLLEKAIISWSWQMT